MNAVPSNRHDSSAAVPGRLRTVHAIRIYGRQHVESDLVDRENSSFVSFHPEVVKIVGECLAMMIVDRY
jgi:hypothetical protein